MKVKVLKVDPYHKVEGWLIPDLVQRLNESLQALGDEGGVTLVGFMTRLWANSGVLLLAAVDEKGSIKGHAAAVTNGIGSVSIIQPRLDEPAENDAVAEMLAEIEVWAKEQGVSRITLVSRRYDAKWSKKHGFEITQYIQVKDIDKPS